ncbi:RNA methyltransferase [Dysgonomonas macrotermitis]|uniref:RNA methyltransferase, TrmH family n=1 Tax=Dysgonomonas macrotermitis TaxID=1346286 RepID=A0A1M5B1Q0_9BACT|nr:RNA methyltransferase [Dysgonomonas macrotermitis]SHF36434.1 RNA methyltransferase, TrmH family [Dysgonomonas macrotermitis]
MAGLTKNKIKYIQSLKNKKDRDIYGTFVAEGDKIVLDLLPEMKCQALLATTDFIEKNNLSAFHDIEELIEVSKSEIERVSFQKNPQQVIAVFYQRKPSYDKMQLPHQLSLALDGIQDPGNMGTIIRLADWYGIENVFCSKDTVDIYNPKVVQATMGALSRVNVYYEDMVSFLQSVSKEMPVYGTFLDGEDMYKTELTQNGIIVMGNEGKGISPDVEKAVSHKLLIPNYPVGRSTSESLNVSVATAIICSEFRRLLLI